MHHRPSGPPFSARLRGALLRWSVHVRAALRRVVPARFGRLALGALVTTTVVGLVLAVPVISGIGSSTPSMALDATSSSSAGDRPGNSPVVMGLDGAPLPSSAEEGTAEPRSATATDTGPNADAPTASTEATSPGTTGSAPEGTPGPTAGTSSSAGSSSTGTTAAGTTAAGTTAPGTTTPGATAPGTTAPDTTTPGANDPAVVPVEPAEAPAPGDAASEAVALINGERTTAGCGALSTDSGLAETAAAHSAAMRAGGALGLDGLDLAGLGGAVAVAQGAPTAQAAVAGWLADAAVSATLLDCARTTIGIGTVDSWWTALLV